MQRTIDYSPPRSLGENRKKPDHTTDRLISRAQVRHTHKKIPIKQLAVDFYLPSSIAKRKQAKKGIKNHETAAEERRSEDQEFILSKRRAARRLNSSSQTASERKTRALLPSFKRNAERKIIITIFPLWIFFRLPQLKLNTKSAWSEPSPLPVDPNES